MGVELGVAGSLAPGEVESGDVHLVHVLSECTLVAVIDGLGHGTEAHRAAHAAVEILRAVPAGGGEHVISLVQRCHAGLRKTRGAVMSLAWFNHRQELLTWIGVGNVAGALLRRNGGHGEIAFLSRAGVVGDHLPLLQASVMQVEPDDVLVMATDGLHAGFGQEEAALESAQVTADRLLARYSKGTDDALVVVAKYRGRDV